LDGFTAEALCERNLGGVRLGHSVDAPGPAFVGDAGGDGRLGVPLLEYPAKVPDDDVWRDNRLGMRRHARVKGVERRNVRGDLEPGKLFGGIEWISCSRGLLCLDAGEWSCTNKCCCAQRECASGDAYGRHVVPPLVSSDFG